MCPARQQSRPAGHSGGQRVALWDDGSRQRWLCDKDCVWGGLGAQQLVTPDEIEGLMEVECWVVSGWGVTWGGGVRKITLASACTGMREDSAGGCPHTRGGPHTSGGWEWEEVMKSMWAGSAREIPGLADGGACGPRGNCCCGTIRSDTMASDRVECLASGALMEKRSPTWTC